VSHDKTNKYSPEVRELPYGCAGRRKDYPSLWSAVESIAPKIGCAAVTLHEWVKKHEIEAGVRDGVPLAERERIKALEREVKELRQANEILRLASAFFAQAELDRLKKK
jgi:transposase-like protein